MNNMYCFRFFRLMKQSYHGLFFCTARTIQLLSQMRKLLNLGLADFFLYEIVTKELAGLNSVQEITYKVLEGARVWYS